MTHLTNEIIKGVAEREIPNYASLTEFIEEINKRKEFLLRDITKNTNELCFIFRLYDYLILKQLYN